MNTYPKKPAPAVGSSRAVIKPALRSESEAGYIYTRAKFTRTKHRYTLSYPLLNKDDLAILRDFFTQNQGQAFKFTHPLETTQRVCVFAMDEFPINDNFQNHSSVEIKLVEI